MHFNEVALTPACVAQIQAAFNLLGNLGLPVDGKLGKETVDAVKKYRAGKPDSDVFAPLRRDLAARGVSVEKALGKCPFIPPPSRVATQIGTDSDTSTVDSSGGSGMLLGIGALVVLALVVMGKGKR